MLVFNWCYHGKLDEPFITPPPTLERGWHSRGREGGGRERRTPVDPRWTKRGCEFNDVEARRTVLAHGDCSLVLAEAGETNLEIVARCAGVIHAELRESSASHRVLLI